MHACRSPCKDLNEVLTNGECEQRCVEGPICVWWVEEFVSGGWRTAETPASRVQEKSATSQPSHRPGAMWDTSLAACKASWEGAGSANGAFSNVRPDAAHLSVTRMSRSSSLSSTGTLNLQGSPATSMAASALLHAHANSSQLMGGLALYS